MLNRVKVVICGRDYILQTEEPPSYVYGLGKMLEKKINQLTTANPSVSQYSASIMVALSSLDDLNKTQINLESVREQAKEYVDEAGKARIERDAAVKEIDFLHSKIEKLEKEIQALKHSNNKK